jgi:hypothetical protein
MMRQNVGRMDAYLRVSGGLTLLGWGVMKRSLPAIAMGSMKVAEGVTRFCPLLYLLSLNTIQKENQDDAFSPVHNG